MTPEMVFKARANAVKGGYRNVEFRLGEIEHLPIADGTVDAVISNYVINLTVKNALLIYTAGSLCPKGRRGGYSAICVHVDAVGKERIVPCLPRQAIS